MEDIVNHIACSQAYISDFGRQAV